ncbi:MAG: DNA repair protein RecN [Phycisphaeraceae bacterium]|nr:DNA repair protein RecN [Phycisphaeraceae bacterium]
MLRELHIQNLAVIEDAALELGEGLNCFTGQTGAGKSLVLGAFEILLGLRSGGLGDWVRRPADEARISGLFEIHDAGLRGELEAILDTPLEDAQLLITRKVFSTGRTSVMVNGRPQVAAVLRRVGEILVDIHGRHDHQYLLKPRHQTEVLDDFGGSGAAAREHAARLAELRALVHRRQELRRSAGMRDQKLRLLRSQLDELDALGPEPGEFERLRGIEKRMAALDRLRRQVGETHQALYEMEGSVVERLSLLAQRLTELAELDDGLVPAMESMRQAAVGLREVAFDLERYVSRLDADPAQAEENQARLNQYHRLLNRYIGIPGPGEDPGALLAAYAGSLRDELRTLDHEDGDEREMAGRIEKLAREVGELGVALEAKRREAAAQLEPLVDRELSELGMSEARFRIAFDQAEESDESEDESAEGSERLRELALRRVEFLIQPNPGQPAAPLRLIASGGELSRIMLAVKSILSRGEHTSVLVFDEIDANIGGRLGTVIGTKLRALARRPIHEAAAFSGCHQVLCITHLPQIAAFADRHLKITKSSEGAGDERTTRSRVERVDGQGRVEELAEMLAGREASRTTLQQAEELLARAREGDGTIEGIVVGGDGKAGKNGSGGRSGRKAASVKGSTKRSKAGSGRGAGGRKGAGEKHR